MVPTQQHSLQNKSHSTDQRDGEMKKIKYTLKTTGVAFYITRSRAGMRSTITVIFFEHRVTATDILHLARVCMIVV